MAVAARTGVVQVQRRNATVGSVAETRTPERQPDTAAVVLNTPFVSLLSFVLVVTLVFMRSVASLALVLSIFNVPAVPGSTSVPFGMIAFHSVLSGPMLQSGFIA